MDLQYTLMNSAVLQRTASNVSCHPVSGKCRAAGKVLMTVHQNKTVLPELSGIEVGSAEKGKLSAILKNIPTGGPYTIELQIAGSKEKALFKDILVGDLWLLAGQSNMADSAYRPSPTPVEPMVHGFYMDNTWGIAKDPLHDTTRAAAPVHGGNPANPPRKDRGAGPGRAFGNAMFQTTGVPQGLIACAHGGTSLEQWAPSKKRLKGKSLYGALYERLQNLGGRVAGVLWYQGCNSTNTADKTASFARDTRKVFNALRRDCKDPELPIVFAQLASYINAPDCQRQSENWLKVRNDQYVMGQKLANTVCVPTIDLPLADTIHISADAADTLGKRMAEAMLNLKGVSGAAPQICVKNISLKKYRYPEFTEAVITFDNVTGSLVSGANPTGFALVNKQGKYHSDAINCRLEGCRAIVIFKTSLSKLRNHLAVAYGASCQPHANIVDSANRSLPCFYRAFPPKDDAVTDFVFSALLSKPIYGDESLESLHYPEDMENLNFRCATTSDLYLRCPNYDGSDENLRKSRVYYFYFQIDVPEKMSLQVLFGADAPFALYCDKKEIIREYTVNPVNIDEFSKQLDMEPGRHDFICAFSSNSGNGWGIACRFKRLDGKKMPQLVELDDLR